MEWIIDFNVWNETDRVDLVLEWLVGVKDGNQLALPTEVIIDSELKKCMEMKVRHSIVTYPKGSGVIQIVLQPGKSGLVWDAHRLDYLSRFQDWILAAGDDDICC